MLLFYFIYMLTVDFSLKILVIKLFLGLTALIIVSRITNRISMKRMVEAHKQLQDLYDQLHDAEELSR